MLHNTKDKVLGRAALGLLVALIACQADAATPQFTVTELQLLPGSFASAPITFENELTGGAAINNFGLGVGTLQIAATGNTPQAVSWSGVVPQALTNLPNIPGSGALGVNSLGTIVGYAGNITGPQGTTAVMWNGSTVSTLPGATAGNSLATAINNTGTVVGTIQNGSFQAVLWSGATVTVLGSGIANGINSSGQVVGFGGNSMATLWSGGTTTNLAGLPGTTASDAYAINDSGMIVGFSQTATHSEATLWSGGTTTDLGALGGGFSEAFDINSSGTIVGSSGNAAVVWIGGQIINLDTLVASQLHGVTLEAASAINDNGQILAEGGGNVYLLNPVPLPASVWLLVSGIGCLLVLSRRTPRDAR